jgi:hypothetical protein
MRIVINHFKKLNHNERAHLNGPNGGWDATPRFSRYADITMSAKIEAVIEALMLDEYDIVADMEVSGLNDAFEKSNSIAGPWIENAEVTELCDEFKDGARSSSVGDIFSDPDTGKYFLVENMGFADITDKVKAAYSVKARALENKKLEAGYA